MMPRTSPNARGRMVLRPPGHFGCLSPLAEVGGGEHIGALHAQSCTPYQGLMLESGFIGIPFSAKAATLAAGQRRRRPGRLHESLRSVQRAQFRLTINAVPSPSTPSTQVPARSRTLGWRPEAP